MAGALLSASWYRVAALKPRLRSHVRLSRHRYRGERWFVMHDPASGRTHRYNPAARLVLNGMDGTRSVEELWAMADRLLGETAPTQDELIQLLAQLHAADVMVCDVTPDVAELFDRGQRQERARVRQRFANPLAIKLPLLDPDRLLNHLWPWLKPLWNRWGLLLWLALVLPAALLAVLNGRELTSNMADRVFAAHNLFMLWLLFPVIKVLHELGHGLATKARGGEVHEMGLMLLVLMPVPYVDATAANAFPNKRDRALVAAAGMGVELALAAVAMFVWLLAEPGLVRAIAFNTVLVAGVSTLVFNGNPLLRFDAYYILCDLIEMPNLGQRANRCLGALLQHAVLGVPDPEKMPPSRGQRVWLVVYAVVSFIYRTWVSVVIILFIAGQMFIVGVLLALWALVNLLVMPLVRLGRHLSDSAALQPVRGRVRATVLVSVMLVLAFVALLPMPFRSQTQGVVWMPDGALVRAGSAGFHSRLVVQPGSLVSAGDSLIESDDPALRMQLRASQARLAQLQAQLVANWVVQPVETALLREALQREETQVARLQARVADLVSRSAGAGVFLVPQPEDLPGRFHAQGAVLAYVVGAHADDVRAVVRVVVAQGDVDLVRNATRTVQLRLASRLDLVLQGQVVREVPAGIDQLPSRAFTTQGGGAVATDPRDRDGLRGLQRSFQLDIALPADITPLYGTRVHVRFDHPATPLAWQWYRSLRQVFLSRFHA